MTYDVLYEILNASSEINGITSIVGRDEARSSASMTPTGKPRDFHAISSPANNESEANGVSKTSEEEVQTVP